MGVEQLSKDDTDRLLTRKETSVRFGIPLRFLELAASRGDGPCLVRLGRLVRYRVSDVREWIDAQVVGK